MANEGTLGQNEKPQPTVVKVRTHPEDVARISRHRTPPLPFDTVWRPPSRHGIEKLVMRGSKLSSLVGPRITRADISQTLDEPLTVVMDIWDKERLLLQSGLLDTKLRISLDQHAFAMTRVAKSGDRLTLEFEDASVNALRQLSDPMKVTRGTTSRIAFVKKLMEEKGAPSLQWYIDSGSPGSITVEKNPLALEGHKERKPGPFQKTTVKGKQATQEQLDNMKVVLGHLFGEGATQEQLAVTICTVTTESSWVNNPGGSGSSVGLFQQTPEGGYNFDRQDRIKAADAFFAKLQKVMTNLPGQAIHVYAQAVQRSGAGKASGGASNYGPWEDESKKTASAWDRAYGGSQNAIATGLYEFRRGGLDGSTETTWECLGRLADEVQYRRFIVEGVFYFLPDELLVGTGPRLVLSERSDGMLTPIDFDMDEGVDPQTCTFSIHTEKWYAPIGTCIEIEEMGPGNGVWLVNKTSGSLLQPFYQDIELVRPRPVLTEPPNDQTVDLATESGGGRSVTTGRTDPTAASLSAGAAAGGPIVGTPKSIIDYIAIPIASEAGVTKTVAQNDIDNHNHTHLGSRSDHAGPPDYKWAADFGIGPDIRGGTNETGAARGDAVAAALAARFGIPWSGAGVVSATHSGFRFQMLWRYESAQAGNHYTHVHFGVRRA